MCFIFMDWIGRWGEKGGVEKKEVERERKRGLPSCCWRANRGAISQKCRVSKNLLNYERVTTIVILILCFSL